MFERRFWGCVSSPLGSTGAVIADDFTLCGLYTYYWFSAKSVSNGDPKHETVGATKT